MLAQTYDQWELLLVDDGSTDASTSIALRYAMAHPTRIRYLAHEGRLNHGASASRNLGARHAAGEYLAFLDADDVYLPRKLEDQVPLLDAHHAVAILYAATEYWFSWSRRPEDAARDWIWRKYGTEPEQGHRSTTDVDRVPAGRRDGPMHGQRAGAPNAVERVGGWEDSFRHICTDQVFHAKMCLRFPSLVADTCWDRYRQHENSVCSTVARAGQSAAAFERYLNWLETYLSAEGIVDPAVWSALRQALRPYRHPLLHRVERRLSRSLWQ